jgi:hypothetical protein
MDLAGNAPHLAGLRSAAHLLLRDCCLFIDVAPDADRREEAAYERFLDNLKDADPAFPLNQTRSEYASRSRSILDRATSTRFLATGRGKLHLKSLR